jgi:predicted RNase H-like HicB family nuclease
MTGQGSILKKTGQCEGGRSGMPELHDYTVVTRPDDNGTYVAYVPAIPGCHAVGKTPDEARAELANVFSMIVEEYAEERRALPPDVRALVAHAG